MLKLNNKKVKEKIKKLIIETWEEEGYLYHLNYEQTKAEIAKEFVRQETNCQGYLLLHEGTVQNTFHWWRCGLPSIVYDEDIAHGTSWELLKDILEETEEEAAKYSEDKAEKIVSNLIYKELEKDILKIVKIHY